MRDEKLNDNNFVGMFFHINKFKYNLDAYDDDNEDPEKIQTRSNLNYADRQNKLSYCNKIWHFLRKICLMFPLDTLSM